MNHALKIIKILYFVNQQHAFRVPCASDSFFKDKSIIIEVLKKNGSGLQYLSDELKNDKEVVLAAVSKSSSALKLASDEIQLFCKGKDPVSSLKAAIAYEELNKDLQIKNTKEKKIKL